MSELFTIKDYSKKNIIITISDDKQFKKWDKLFSKIGAYWNREGWVIKKDKKEEVQEIIDENCQEDSNEEKTLIKKLIGLRLMSKSSQKEIEANEIENSDVEDVISLCRRIRHLYKIIKHQQLEIKELKSRINLE